MITDKKYTEDHITKILEECPGLYLRDIQIKLGSGMSTTRKLVFAMLDKGTVSRKDTGTEKKPIFTYFIAGESK